MNGRSVERSTRRQHRGVPIGSATLALAVGLGGAPTALAQTEPEQVQKLLADDGAEDDYFGQRVAMSGDTALIGANDCAYVFVLHEGAWIQQAKLVADDGEPGDCFGHVVALDGDTALIGANQDDDNGNLSGSAYVFARERDVWTQQAKLHPSDPDEIDKFGWSVAVHGDTAVIGAPYDDTHGADGGSAYVFVREDDVWTQQAKLVTSGGQAYDLCGYTVAVYGDAALVGAIRGNGCTEDSGAVYAFRRTGGAWSQHGQLVVDDLQEDDDFGRSLALEDNAAIVGAPRQNNWTGAAYLFEYDGSAWQNQAKLVASDAAEHATFGWDVAINGDVALVGAKGVNFEAGAVYGFYAPTGLQLCRIVPEDSTQEDGFCPVALLGETALIGAPHDDDNGSDSGSVYVFDLNLDCPADITGDGVVNASDLLRLLALWGQEGGEADINHDGIVNTADLLELLAAWGECP
jgi:hypothetical protein